MRARSSRLSQLLFTLVTLCSLGGCGERTHTPLQPSQPGLGRDVQPIFNVTCLGCHLHGRAIGSLDLAPGVAHESLVGAPSTQSPLLLVSPGAPEASYLLHKLAGTHAEVGGHGDRMPVGARTLTAEQLERVRRWIAEGAAP